MFTHLPVPLTHIIPCTTAYFHHSLSTNTAIISIAQRAEPSVNQSGSYNCQFSQNDSTLSSRTDASTRSTSNKSPCPHRPSPHSHPRFPSDQTQSRSQRHRDQLEKHMVDAENHPHRSRMKVHPSLPCSAHPALHLPPLGLIETRPPKLC
jgi:hypothetical protein